MTDTSPTSSAAVKDEVYDPISPVSEKELTPVHSNYVPTQVNKHLEFIDFNSVGDLALGTSSLVSRYWTGQLWYHKASSLGEGDNVTDPEYCLTGLDIDTGVMGGRFVTDQQLLLGLDSGAVVLVNLTKEVEGDRVMHYLEQQAPLLEHEDLLTGLDLWGEVGQDRGSQQHLAASVGADLRLNIYCPSLSLAQSYSPVHERLVTGLSCCPGQTNLLATASMDGRVKVWDTRQARPALTVYHNTSQPPSSVSWARGGEGLLVVGTREGGLVTVDTRQAGVEEETIKLFDREVRRFAWSRGGERLAVAADDAVVKVVRLSKGHVETDYSSSSSHTDFVRGLAWDQEDNLWSAAWDKTVVRHSVTG